MKSRQGLVRKQLRDSYLYCNYWALLILEVYFSSVHLLFSMNKQNARKKVLKYYLIGILITH